MVHRRREPLYFPILGSDFDFIPSRFLLYAFAILSFQMRLRLFRFPIGLYLIFHPTHERSIPTFVCILIDFKVFYWLL
jgi:hypothetical protein